MRNMGIRGAPAGTEIHLKKEETQKVWGTQSKTMVVI